MVFCMVWSASSKQFWNSLSGGSGDKLVDISSFAASLKQWLKYNSAIVVLMALTALNTAHKRFLQIIVVLVVNFDFLLVDTNHALSSGQIFFKNRRINVRPTSLVSLKCWRISYYWYRSVVHSLQWSAKASNFIISTFVRVKPYTYANNMLVFYFYWIIRNQFPLFSRMLSFFCYIDSNSNFSFFLIRCYNNLTSATQE